MAPREHGVSLAAEVVYVLVLMALLFVILALIEIAVLLLARHVASAVVMGL